MTRNTGRAQCAHTADPCNKAVLDGTHEGAFRQRHPGFRPANHDQVLPEAA